MRKATKIWLITAGSLVLIGGIIFGGVMSMLKWDFMKLSTVKYETNTYAINKAFRNISLKTDTADIIFALSDDEKCRVVCYEQEKARHSVTVQEDILTIQLIDQRSVRDFIKYIGINFGSPKITIYLPKAEYASLLINKSTGNINIPKDFYFRDVDISLSTGDVDFYASAADLIKINTTTGDICAKNVSAGALAFSVSTGMVTASDMTCEGNFTVSVSTGKAKLTNITCQNLISKGSTGDISLNNVIATEAFSIARSTGDVSFDRSDAADISVKTSTGDVTGSLLTDKVFITETSTGRINVPNTTTGGSCEIRTNTGKIQIEIK